MWGRGYGHRRRRERQRSGRRGGGRVVDLMWRSCGSGVGGYRSRQ